MNPVSLAWGREGLVDVFIYLNGSYREDKERLSSSMHKEQQVIITAAMRKNNNKSVRYKAKFFTKTKTKPNSQVTPKGCVSILEDCHSSTGQGLDVTHSLRYLQSQLCWSPCPPGTDSEGRSCCSQRHVKESAQGPGILLLWNGFSSLLSLHVCP